MDHTDERKPMAAVERTTKLVTHAPDLPAVWAFVMDSLEQVGPRPTVSIDPIATFEDVDGDGFYFEVSVEGTDEITQPSKETRS